MRLAPLSFWQDPTASTGSSTSHSALPAPAVFLFVLGDCAPVCRKATGERGSRNRTFVQFVFRALKTPARRVDTRDPVATSQVASSDT
jgi:hypothetical protein